MLNNNSLAFIALANEYCHALEDARSRQRQAFVVEMLRLLPRLYITATDLDAGDILDLELEEMYIEPSLDEQGYDEIRRSVESLMGEDDVYLETFEEDMKYSDTPISASISEGLADIFQTLYNFTEMVKQLPDYLMPGAILAVKEEFRAGWSRPLCNTLRALNALNNE